MTTEHLHLAARDTVFDIGCATGKTWGFASGSRLPILATGGTDLGRSRTGWLKDGRRLADVYGGRVRREVQQMTDSTPEDGVKRPFRQRRWLWLVAAVLVVLIVVGALGDKSKNTATTAPTSTTTTAPVTTGTSGTTATTRAPTTTIKVPTTTARAPTATTTPPTTAPTTTFPPTTVASGPPAGATALCNDGTYSYSATHSGSCSHHGGVAQFYTP